MRTSQKPLRLSREPNMAKVQDNSLPVGSGSGQIVLVLQGGGALGAYQAGVYEALDEAGIEPDWIIGTSIGAINASLIAGNEPHERVAKLHAFWQRIEQSPDFDVWSALPWVGRALPNWGALANGI